MAMQPSPGSMLSTRGGSVRRRQGMRCRTHPPSPRAPTQAAPSRSDTISGTLDGTPGRTGLICRASSAPGTRNGYNRAHHLTSGSRSPHCARRLILSEPTRGVGRLHRYFAAFMGLLLHSCPVRTFLWIVRWMRLSRNSPERLQMQLRTCDMHVSWCKQATTREA